MKSIRKPHEYQQSACDLLHSTNIIDILKLFGEPYIVGSYAFDLMTEPDIDLEPILIGITSLKHRDFEAKIQKYE
jgi:hypothetical protein